MYDTDRIDYVGKMRVKVGFVSRPATVREPAGQGTSYIDIEFISQEDLDARKMKFKPLTNEHVYIPGKKEQATGAAAGWWHGSRDEEKIDKIMDLLGAYQILLDKEDIGEKELNFRNEISAFLFEKKGRTTWNMHYDMINLDLLHQKIFNFIKKEDLQQMRQQSKEYLMQIQREEDAKIAKKNSKRKERREQFRGVLKSMARPFVFAFESAQELAESLKSKAEKRKNERERQRTIKMNERAWRKRKEKMEAQNIEENVAD